MPTSEPKPCRCDNCGIEGAPYTRTEYDGWPDPVSGGWHRQYYTANYCGECAEEIMPDFKRRYDADCMENV